MVSDRSLDESQRIPARRILHGKLRAEAFPRPDGHGVAGSARLPAR